MVKEKTHKSVNETAARTYMVFTNRTCEFSQPQERTARTKRKEEKWEANTRVARAGGQEGGEERRHVFNNRAGRRIGMKSKKKEGMKEQKTQTALTSANRHSFIQVRNRYGAE